MSGEGTKAIAGNLACPDRWSGRNHSGAFGDGIRRGTAAAARGVRHLSVTRADSDNLEPELVGLDIHDRRLLQDRGGFEAFISSSCLDDRDLNRALALSVNVIPDSLTVKSSGHGSLYVNALRILDVVSNPPQGVTRGMPPVGVVAVLAVLILLIEPSDWIGELKGALAVLVPVLLYWWKKKGDERSAAKAEAHETADSILRFSGEKEKRLEERASQLRVEEREFMHRQMELSRRRSHILARGYMAVELANDRLIEMLRERGIDVPQITLTYKTRAMILSELKELESGSDPERDSPSGE